MKSRHTSRAKVSPFNVILFIGLLLLALSLVVPFLWGAMTSLKTRLDYNAEPLALPAVLNWQNYKDAFSEFKVTVEYGLGTRTYNMLGMAINSVIYSLGGALVQAFACALVAYAVAHFPKYKCSKLLYGIVIVTMVLPIVGSLPSELRILKSLGMYNTMLGLMFMKANFLGTYFLVFHAFFTAIPGNFLGTYFLVFHAFFTAIPGAYFEAAKLDGAGNFSILRRIVLPMSKSMLFTVTLLNFLGNWNDYNVSLVYAPSYPTLAYGLYKFNLSNNPIINSVPHKMAGAMMLFIPILIIFCIFADKLINSNLTMGGVKE